MVHLEGKVCGRFFSQSCFVSCSDHTGLVKFLALHQPWKGMGVIYLLPYMVHSFLVTGKCGKCELCTNTCVGRAMVQWWWQQLKRQEYLDIILPTLQDINLELLVHGWLGTFSEGHSHWDSQCSCWKVLKHTTKTPFLLISKFCRNPLVPLDGNHMSVQWGTNLKHSSWQEVFPSAL